MSHALSYLETQFHRIAQLDHASTFLSWDQMVIMPDKGMEPRSTALAELASMRHELLTNPKVEESIDQCEQALHAGEIEQHQASHIREMKRSWQQAQAVPADLVKAKIIAGAKCEHAWRTQKADNDWKGFLANFKDVVTLSREEAAARQTSGEGSFNTPYDALLDLHCAGDSQSMIGQLFAELKAHLPQLLQQVMEHQSQQTVRSLAGQYAIADQQRLSEHLMARLGFDFKAGRLDVSMHPFSTGVQGDQRITTRYREDDFADALQATAHETGHASYEAGLPAHLKSYPVGQSRNMCIHESQSLLFEKHVCLSRAFGEAMIDQIHACLPTTKSLSAQDIWRVQTQVKPSYIRVEADEVTYPLHVLLRYDIESALINQTIEADVIPEVWEDAMQTYFGLSVGGEHAIGCLQDIHWTDGAFGYFPSYTIGAVNAAQLSQAMKKDFPDWQAKFRQGDTGFVREWLADAIWQKGSELESQALMEAATGEGSNAKYLLQHLESRYLEEID